ncbi:uncharacterized protein LACBIDRAFT_324253 [Laccaria bicolor S238N-H82]|uniref:Predicted protein n=1 Tax=Laccaria bicolor (strain S238N-H82 / ATCC MYA-4686) TaxID=486041 RepID=B0D186_LACBS|nr:uncharacterized protein LACBIDRAFT_324253 [Laccaria bicolor S238N-H82]EDR11957.1 predicted protein [Laccaria bicolor S238N-H82]|eukprot:XP_001877854.1 predicted protein [Laccaria bicolor S238N-H82]
MPKLNWVPQGFIPLRDLVFISQELRATEDRVVRVPSVSNPFEYVENLPSQSFQYQCHTRAYSSCRRYQQFNFRVFSHHLNWFLLERRRRRLGRAWVIAQNDTKFHTESKDNAVVSVVSSHCDYL